MQKTKSMPKITSFPYLPLYDLSMRFEYCNYILVPLTEHSCNKPPRSERSGPKPNSFTM